MTTRLISGSLLLLLSLGGGCSDDDGDAATDAGVAIDADQGADAEPGADAVPGPDAGFDASCPEVSAGEQVGQVAEALINEASGLTASRQHPGVLWVHNDSGDSARLFALSQDGTHLGIYNLSGASAVDWEDMAADSTHLYLGDIGDNNEVRSHVVVYRVVEPSVAVGQTPVSVDLTGVEALELTYPDRAHNAETLLVDPIQGDLYIVTKEDQGESVVFRDEAPHSPGTRTTLQPVATLDFGGSSLPGSHLTTGGDVSPAGDMILIRTYNSAYLWLRPPATDFWAAFDAQACVAQVRSEPQGEAVGFDQAGAGYFTVSERMQQPIWYFVLNP